MAIENQNNSNLLGNADVIADAGELDLNSSGLDGGNIITTNKVRSVSIESAVPNDFLTYAHSVNTVRAIPNCHDGLKFVHRRTIWTMHITGNRYDKPYRKSARIVGDVMGRFHPHGDTAIYLSIVRLAQSFSMMAPLVDGQGNFGSIDGDNPAQMRYTEVRLSKLGDIGMLSDIDEDTVDFQDNYDGTEKEPRVLPVRFPNLLVNGSSGIAVGMATNVPTHNLAEILDACCAYIDNHDITAEEMLQYVPAPDFPTGGIIVRNNSLRNAMLTGRGSIIMRGKASIETMGNRKAIIIHEIPYQVNKSELVANIENLARNKIVDGLLEVRDESNKLGIRIVVEFRKDIEGEVLLNQLYKNTQLETFFGVNILALKDGQPKVMNVREIISSFIKFREEVVIRRTRFNLIKCKNRAHILIGLLIANLNIDEIVALIRRSKDVAEALENLMQKKWSAQDGSLELILAVQDQLTRYDGEKLSLTEAQAKAILEMRLQRLTNLEKNKLVAELEALIKDIAEYLSILASRSKLLSIIRSEFVAIKEAFGQPRKTEVALVDSNIDDKDLIQQEDVVVMVTKDGYIKRTPVSVYRDQRRGGRGKSGISVHDDDIVTQMIVTTTHHKLFFFSDLGKVYALDVFRLPQGSLQSKGRAIVNLISLGTGEKITRIMPVTDFDEEAQQGNFLVFVTTQGKGRRNAFADFDNIHSNGKIAMKLTNEDKLIDIAVAQENDHMLIATRYGKAIRFTIDEIRVFKGRTSTGVTAVRLKRKDDAVVSMCLLAGIDADPLVREGYLRIPLEQRIRLSEAIQDRELNNGELGFIDFRSFIQLNDQELAELNIKWEDIEKLATHEQFILTITSTGYGKRTSSYEYRVTGRGGQGVTNIDLSEKSRKVVCAFPVSNKDSIMISTEMGVMIRILASEIRVTGRSTMGVKIIDLQPEDFVNSVSKIVESSEKNGEI